MEKIEEKSCQSFRAATPVESNEPIELTRIKPAVTQTMQVDVLNNLLRLCREDDRATARFKIY